MSTIALTQKWTMGGTFTGSTGAVNTPAMPIAITESQSWGNGTGTNQANQWYETSGNAAGSTVTIDIVGGISDAFGATITTLIVKMLLIRSTTVTAGFDLTIGGTFVDGTILTGTSPVLVLGPGGLFCITAPGAGYAATGGTDDTITLAPGANTIGYRLYLLAEV